MGSWAFPFLAGDPGWQPANLFKPRDGRGHPPGGSRWSACRRVSPCVSGVFTWLCGEGICVPQVKAQIPIGTQLLATYCVLIGLGVPFRGFSVFV